MGHVTKKPFVSFVYYFVSLIFFLSIPFTGLLMYIGVHDDILKLPAIEKTYDKNSPPQGPSSRISLGVSKGYNWEQLNQYFPKSRYIWVFFILPLILISWITIIFFLKRIFKTVLKGNPFNYENVLRIRWIGILSIVMALAYYFSLGFLFMGLIVLALSEVFKTGITLKEEQSLTI